MIRVAVYDPPLCCSTGVCGPTVDPVLPRVAADLDWLKRQGVAVERYNLAQQAQAFATHPVVTAELREHGNDCLPLILVDGKVAARSAYPSREELAQMTGVSLDHKVSPAPETRRETGPFPWESCCSTGPASQGPDPQKCC